MNVTYSTDGSLGTITLSAPPQNRLCHPVFADITELSTFLATPEIKAVTIRGEGSHFCAGADVGTLRDQARDPEQLASWLAHGKTLLQAISGATVPVLALLRGSCLGAGLEIALACHFRYASESAVLGFPETELGLMPGFGGTSAAPSLISRGAVVELILSGRMVRAPEAFDLGLVDRVLPTREIEAEAVSFLRSLTDSRPAALIRAAMESIRNGQRLPREEALRRETELFAELARNRYAGDPSDGNQG